MKWAKSAQTKEKQKKKGGEKNMRDLHYLHTINRSLKNMFTVTLRKYHFLLQQ